MKGGTEARRGAAIARRRLLLLSPFLPLLLSPSPARAQAPDSAAAPPPAVLPIAPEGPQPGEPVTPVPALTPALDAAGLLDAAPGTFVYDLGAPGWPDGLSLDGLAPEAHVLTFGGLPYDDLFTGRPRADLLPLEALDRLRLDATRYGRPGAVVATVRPFRAAAPVTELRYLPGQEGIQYVAATHAQTRRLPALLRDADGHGRLTALASVGGRQAGGSFAGEDLGGWYALARLSLARPGLAVEATEHHVSHTHGARSGLAPPAGAGFSAVFDPFQAVVLQPDAERQSERNDLALTLRVPLFDAQPLTAEAWWTRQHERYTADGIDTLTAKGNRFGGRLAQPFQVGPHGLLLRLDGWYDGASWGVNDPYGAPSRVQLHAALRDSVRVAGWLATAEAGAHAADGTVWPAAALRVERGGVFVGAAHAAEATPRIAEVGYAGIVTGLSAGGPLARTTRAEAGGAFAVGPFAFRVRLYANQTTGPLVLDEEAGAFAFVTASAPFRRAGGTVALAWRGDAPRGFYVTARAEVFRFLNPGASDLHRRAADALPEVWGCGRLGLRFLGSTTAPTSSPSTPSPRTGCASGCSGRCSTERLARTDDLHVEVGRVDGGRLEPRASATTGAG